MVVDRFLPSRDDDFVALIGDNARFKGHLLGSILSGDISYLARFVEEVLSFRGYGNKGYSLSLYQNQRQAHKWLDFISVHKEQPYYPFRLKGQSLLYRRNFKDGGAQSSKVQVKLHVLHELTDFAQAYSQIKRDLNTQGVCIVQL